MKLVYVGYPQVFDMGLGPLQPGDKVDVPRHLAQLLIVRGDFLKFPLDTAKWPLDTPEGESEAPVKEVVKEVAKTGDDVISKQSSNPKVQGDL